MRRIVWPLSVGMAMVVGFLMGRVSLPSDHAIVTGLLQSVSVETDAGRVETDGYGSGDSTRAALYSNALVVNRPNGTITAIPIHKLRKVSFRQQ